MRFGFCLASFACGLLAGCASRPLPKYEKPIARAQFQTVRTTAYTHTEADHLKHGTSTAMGGQLQSGEVQSAAADWSRWPAGTRFRIVETGEIYEVDDYGWALAGTNTIDLYKPTRDAMNAWGVRRVHIENLAWGDPHRCVSVLRPRSKFRHVRRMLDEFASNDRTFPPLAPMPPMVVANAAPIAVARPARIEAPRAPPVASSAGVMKPFYGTQ